jgi:hypothetical protein
MVRLPSSEGAYFEVEEIAFDVADDLAPVTFEETRELDRVKGVATPT